MRMRFGSENLENLAAPRSVSDAMTKDLDDVTCTRLGRRRTSGHGHRSPPSVYFHGRGSTPSPTSGKPLKHPVLSRMQPPQAIATLGVATGGVTMAVFKEMQFAVSVRWRGGRLATTKSTGKEPIEVATPPEFRDGLAGYWSPEDLLVASVASCFTLTLAAVAEKGEAPLLDATVTATGHLSHRDDGRYGFVAIEVDATLETIPGGEQMVRRAARIAEERCLVSQALDVPVHVGLKVSVVASVA
jgi:organic hydroperoxide reductase OsmC/OhrA